LDVHQATVMATVQIPNAQRGRDDGNRTVMRRRWREWDGVPETTAFAVAA
jgi:hypothetical protein